MSAVMCSQCSTGRERFLIYFLNFPQVSYFKIGMIGHMVSPHGKYFKLSVWSGGSCVWKGL